MSPREEIPCAASTLVSGLLTPSLLHHLVEVARTSVSVHFETGQEDVPVLCVCTPGAVRLPASIVTSVLPTSPTVAHGGLREQARRWTVTRWWRPPRPRGLAAPSTLPHVPGVEVPEDVVPWRLVGNGPGLTPYGDDVLAGALVAAHAVGHPRLPWWQAGTSAALAAGRTTAVSTALLRHAVDGWATSELAAFVTGVCRGRTDDSIEPLLAVGHTSGAGLAAGALHALGTAQALRRAA